MVFWLRCRFNTGGSDATGALLTNLTRTDINDTQIQVRCSQHKVTPSSALTEQIISPIPFELSETFRLTRALFHLRLLLRRRLGGTKVSYRFRGRLCGYFCEESSEQLSDVVVRIYRNRKDQNVTALAVADPGQTLSLSSDEQV